MQPTAAEALSYRQAALNAARLQALTTASMAKIFPCFNNQSATVMGINFPNRLGIAAGFDTQGNLGKAAGALGFGCIELGTWTLDQLTSLPIQDAVQNCIAARIGINLSIHSIINSEKLFINKTSNSTPDYISLNIADNTTEDNIILSINKINEQEKNIPIVLKITVSQLLDQPEKIINKIKNLPIHGIAIAFDLGKPVTQDKYLFWQESKNQKNLCCKLEAYRQSIPSGIALIAIGGVIEKSHYQDRINAGADLVQVHNTLVFNGPNIATSIVANKI